MNDFFLSQKNKKIIIVGDFNIAPLENDVWSHKQLLKIVSHTPIEVEKLTLMRQSLNFIDTQRFFVDEKEKLYSWWSYRAKDPLTSNKGRRLDHIWATPNLKPYIKSMKIYQDFRTATQPSDHVPIETEFKI
jgi:exodeoxyribonuclease-3